MRGPGPNVGRGCLLLLGVGLAAVGRHSAFVAPSAPQPPPSHRSHFAHVATRAGPFPQADVSTGSSTGTFSAAAFALVASAACALASQKRSSSRVLMHMFPAQGKPNRQTVLRRLQPFGEIPAWTRKPLLKKKLIQPWRKRKPKPLSMWGRQRIEMARLRYHYNIKYYQLKTYMIRAFKKGIEYPVDHLMQELESRLENFLYRVGLAPTMAAAHWCIRRNLIQWKSGDRPWYVCNVPSLRLKPGDLVRVRPTDKIKNCLQKMQEDTARNNIKRVRIPENITWDKQNLEGTYLGPCDINELGLVVDERLITRGFGSDHGVYRTHFRFFKGTRIPIHKGHRGGRIRPTPENVLNMNKGVGLRKVGRQRPPSLWGTKYPRNDPYEVSYDENRSEIPRWRKRTVGLNNWRPY